MEACEELREHDFDPSDLLNKLSNELRTSEQCSRAQYHWYCCECGEGPICLEGPAGLDASSEEKPFDLKEVCIHHRCAHIICAGCKMVLSEHGKLDDPIDLKQLDMTSGIHIDSLIMSEQKLAVFTDMSPYYLHGTQKRIPECLHRLSSNEILGPEDPDTPGLTASSAPSPGPNDNDEENKLTLQILDSQIKVKKSECRFRLAEVWYKKWAQKHATTDLTEISAASPTADFLSRLEDPGDFILVWHHTILPFLAEFIPKWCGESYTIGIRRGIHPIARFIDVMTEEDWTEQQKEVIKYHVLDLLPPKFHETTGFQFQTGSLERLASSTTSVESDLDSICYPQNAYHYQRPTMGDSVGVAVGQGDDHSTSTLGPCLQIGEQAYWLLNLHPLEKAIGYGQQKSPLLLEHPSYDDQNLCKNSGHGEVRDLPEEFHLGIVTRTSGRSTGTRISKNVYWTEAFIDPPHIIMDWAICTAKFPTTNFERSSVGPDIRTDRHVITITQAQGGAPVCSTGRTSGCQRGQIGLCPDLVSKKVTGAAHDTMEWFVEEPYPYDNEDHFTESGIGVSGDSGAAIVDEESHALVGQLWGRNKYRKRDQGPRVTYFTPIQDIFDDIQDRCSLPERPRLPQLDDAYPDVWPACDECRGQQLASQLLMLPAPAFDFDDSSPPEGELLTPETSRSPDLRRLDFCHVGLASPLPFDGEDVRERGVYDEDARALLEYFEDDSEETIDLGTGYSLTSRESPRKRSWVEDAAASETKKLRSD